MSGTRVVLEPIVTKKLLGDCQHCPARIRTKRDFEYHMVVWHYPIFYEKYMIPGKYARRKQ